MRESSKIILMIAMIATLTLSHYIMFYLLRSDYPILTLINLICSVIGYCLTVKTIEVYFYVKTSEENLEILERIIETFS